MLRVKAAVVVDATDSIEQSGAVAYPPERGLRGFAMHLKVVGSRVNRKYEDLDAELRQVIEEAYISRWSPT